MGLSAHKFYHKNFPAGAQVRDSFPKDIELTFLKDTKFPTIVYTGNQRLIIPKGLGNKFDKKLVKKVSKQGLKIYLYEPLCCYIKDKHYNNSFYTEFSIKDDMSLVRSEELDSVQRLIDIHGFTNVTVYTCDYNVKKYLQPHYNFNIECKDLFLSDIKNAVKRTPGVKKIEKHFWCAIGRYTYPRHLIISYLANFPGHYAWHYIYKRNMLEHTSWLEKEKLTEPMCALLEHGNTLLNENYHYIDIQLDERETVGHQHGVYIPAVHDLRSHKFFESYDKSFVAIVAETRYAQPTANVSEKLLTCISSKTPFILLAPPYSLEYVRSLGFKTFSKFWSEEYDTIEDPTLRLRKIFNLIDEIARMDLSQLEKIHLEMVDVLEYNHNILNKLQ